MYYWWFFLQPKDAVLSLNSSSIYGSDYDVSKNKLVKIIKDKQWFTWGWSEIVNFMAVTTVVRIRGEGDVNAAWSWGNKFSGHIRQSLPKHSATTFRVPEINNKNKMETKIAKRKMQKKIVKTMHQICTMLQVKKKRKTRLDLKLHLKCQIPLDDILEL